MWEVITAWVIMHDMIVEEERVDSVYDQAQAELLRNKTGLWPAHNFVQKVYKKA
jgi:hypothetical protein